MKERLSTFLSRNPFPFPHTLGFFYREKMRAIHRIAPDDQFQTILEVGGGRSGLTAMLYPSSEVYNLDSNPEYADAPCNRQVRVTYVCGGADSLPFPDAHFDAVTMFDLLTLVADDRRAVAEALRVLRPKG